MGRRQERFVAVIPTFIIYTFLPEVALFYLQKLSILLSIINSHKQELFARTSGLILFWFTEKNNMIYILKVKLNIISPQCLTGAKPPHMKSENKTTANNKKFSPTSVFYFQRQIWF